MYLKKIEIAGFKSFAQKTVLDFSSSTSSSALASSSSSNPVSSSSSVSHPSRSETSTSVIVQVGKNSDDQNARYGGITAVVGPNGSGKSNIADAIRWAIGEQSLKNLRGKKLEDVIFAGSGNKARLGSASVTLHFDNSDKRIPLEFTEVSITRKLYRSGESEYLLNGARVRLLDVVDVLAKSGIGKDSYCVITQGMSDAMLSASPFERRGIIEDAAGVKHYQIQKDRSLRKVESTTDNLFRVEALIHEIEPHLKNLKRQADKASQGKVVAETLRAKQVQLYSYLWHHFDIERKKFTQERDVFTQQLTNADAQSQSLNEALSKESIQAEDQQVIDALEKKIRDMRIVLNGAEREAAIVDGRIEAEKERQAPREVVQQTLVDLKYVQMRLQECRTDQERLISRLQAIETLDQIQEVKELARVIQTRMHELHEDAGKGSVIKKIMVTLSDAELQESNTRLEQLSARKKSLTQEITEMKTEVAQHEQVIIGEREKSRKSREAYFELERQVRASQQSLSALKDALNESKIRLARVEVREEDLTAKIAEELHTKPEELRFDGVEIVPETVEREIARLKVTLEHIGSIDPLIVEEYQETEQRYAFLTQESADLKKAIESLRAIMKEMDEKIHKEFDTAFKAINKEFEHYFTLIFGGGKASLAKVPLRTLRAGSTDENDNLEDSSALLNQSVGISPDAYIRDESGVLRDAQGNAIDDSSRAFGIDIIASPPGKKIHNLSMLSGGERSLTSLALLFAIISHNPPPFAVLDEVEAALDEANSQRFSRVLQELAHRTQFIAITHNRATMREASLLYGVTMGDDGVSKLLSVKLDDVKGKVS